MGSNERRAALLQELFEAFDEVEAAETALRERLRLYRSAIRKSRRHYERGGTTPELIEALDTSEDRAANTDVLQTLGAARVRAQHAVYRVAAADGMTAADIGRAWGVSRQLVSRVLVATDE